MNRRRHGRPRTERMAGWSGTPGVRPLSCSWGEGEADLTPDWPALLKDLPVLGRVLMITLNQHAVLGEYTYYPEMTVTEAGGAVDRGGNLELELSTWVQVKARRQVYPGRQTWALEFFDRAAHSLHKICLTPDSHRENFEDLVEAYRRTACFRPSAPILLPSTPRRIEPVEGRDYFRFSPTLLRRWLEEAKETEQPVRVLVGNEGVVQAATIQIEETMDLGEWVFFKGDAAGLHLRWRGLGGVMLHNIGADRDPCWTLKAYNAAGHLMTVLAPPLETDRQQWNRSVLSLVQQG